MKGHWKTYGIISVFIVFVLSLLFIGKPSNLVFNPQKKNPESLCLLFKDHFGLDLKMDSITDLRQIAKSDLSIKAKQALSIQPNWSSRKTVNELQKVYRKVVFSIYIPGNPVCISDNNKTNKESLKSLSSKSSKPKKVFFWGSILVSSLIIVLWVTELISIYITALIPVVLAIPMGLLTPSKLAESYGNSNIYLFLGGFILALGLEKWKVHEQIAKKIISIVGDSKPRILLGFMLSTGLLSMWISNTATALLMMPMALAIIHAMPHNHQKGKFAVLLMLTIAYASSIGGIGTLVGSPPNTQMAAILEDTYHIKVGFIEWMKIGVPLSLLMLAFVYFLFYLLLGKERNDVHDFKIEAQPWTKNQKWALGIFLSVVILWVFRELLSYYLPFEYTDEGVSILGAIALFLFPSKESSGNLLEWKDTQKLPWGILVLFGGGLALAAMLEQNGVIMAISQAFLGAKEISIFVILAIVIVVAVFASELLSNLALVTIFTPLVAAFAIQAGIPVLSLCIPLTFGASLAFMMPVGTPPNAIVFSSGILTFKSMMKIGFLINIIGIVLIYIFALSLI